MNMQEIKKMAEMNREFGKKVIGYAERYNKIFQRHSEDEVIYVGTKIHKGRECAICQIHTKYDGFSEWFIPIVDILMTEEELQLKWKDKVMKSYPNRIEYTKRKINESKVVIKEMLENIEGLKRDLRENENKLREEEETLEKYKKL